jgi:hypothetical protein
VCFCIKLSICHLYAHKDWCYVVAEFGSLTASGLIAEVKKLYDVAYQLGVEEAKEMTRGNYLKILTKTHQ